MLRAEPRAEKSKQFTTTSLPLAASLLCHIPSATLLQVSSELSIDGKRLLIVGYPPDQTKAVQDTVEKFHSRRLVVPLYVYNRALNALRDRLKQGEGCHVP